MSGQGGSGWGYDLSPEEHPLSSTCCCQVEAPIDTKLKSAKIESMGVSVNTAKAGQEATVPPPICHLKVYKSDIQFGCTNYMYCSLSASSEMILMVKR